MKRLKFLVIPNGNIPIPDSIKQAKIIYFIAINSASIPPIAIAIGTNPPQTVFMIAKTFPLMSCGTVSWSDALINVFTIALKKPAINNSTNIYLKLTIGNTENPKENVTPEIINILNLFS